MRNIVQVVVLGFLFSACSEFSFNREQNRSGIIGGTLTEDSKALAVAYANALNEGNAQSLSLADQNLDPSKIKRFRTKLYQLIAGANLTSVADGCSEGLLLEVSGMVPIAMDHAGIKPTANAVARISAVSFTFCELSDDSRERVLTNILAGTSFDRDEALTYASQFMNLIPDDQVHRVPRALIRNSDQLAGETEALLANLAKGSSGRSESAVAGIMAESIELLGESDPSYSGTALLVENFRNSVPSELKDGPLKSVFNSFEEILAQLSEDGQGLNADPVNLDGLNKSLKKAKELAKQHRKKANKKTTVVAVASVAQAPAADPSAGNSSNSSDSAGDQTEQNLVATTKEFDFASSGDYVYGSSAIDVAGGSASLKVMDLTTDTSSEIGLGTSNGVAAVGNSLGLTTNSNLVSLDSGWTPHFNQIAFYYKFDGNLQDASGNGNHATSYGDPTFTTDAQIGTHSIDFDGDGDYIDTGYILNVALTDTFTFAGWVKSDTDDSSNIYLAGSASAGVKNNSFDLRFTQTTGRFRSFYRASSGSTKYEIKDIMSSSKMTTSQWEHVVAVFDGPNNKTHIYVNGRHEDTQTYTNFFDMNTGHSMYIGTTNQVGSPRPTDMYSGQVDEFAYWTVNLTKHEIQKIYHRQRNTFGGSYVSKVFDAGQDVELSTIKVTSPLPFGKQVTTLEETTAQYSDIENVAGNRRINDGLVALYHFDETSGTTAFDSSGNGHDAAETGSGSGTVSGQLGQIGYATEMRGKHYAVPDHDDFETNHFSVALWYHPNTGYLGTDNGFDSIIADGPHSTDGARWNLRYHGDPGAGYADGRVLNLSLKFDDTNIGDSGWYTGIESTNQLPASQWNHLAATFDGTTARLYVNGAEVASATSDDDGDLFSGSTLVTNSDPLNIGKRMRGFLDELVIWNRAISAAEVLELYRQGDNKWDIQVRTCASSDCSDQESINGAGWSQATGAYELGEYYNHTSVAGGIANHSTGSPSASAPFFHLPTMGVGNVSQPVDRRYLQHRLHFFGNHATHRTTLSSVSLNSRVANSGSGAVSGPYPASKPELVTRTAVAFSSLTSMAITASGNPRFALSNDGGSTFKYWNGSAWAVAGAEVGASAADTTANVATFPGGNIVVKVIFETNSTGDTGASVSNIVINGLSPE